MKLETKLIHGGEPSPRPERAVVLPVYQSANYVFAGESDYNDIRYIRLNNTPNHVCLAAKLAELESAESAVVTASGMAAISTALLALVEEGGNVLAQDSLYGGTFHFLKENFPGLGRKVSFFSLDHACEDYEKELQPYLTPQTRVLYLESVSNPLLKIPDLEGMVEFARKHGLITLIDNTFPSPINFNPIEIGIDVVLHSATKYLNGHSDIVGGVVLGKTTAVKKVTTLLNHLGGSMDPHTCFLLHRGLKTLAVRVRTQNESALSLAQALQAHPKIKKVLYPGLPSHAHHERAKKFFRGFGGMLAFEYGDSVAETDAFLGRLKIPLVAPSLGGVETLVTRPVSTSHAGVSKEDLDKLGIRDTLVRVSVGLENSEDLIADFLQAL